MVLLFCISYQIHAEPFKIVYNGIVASSNLNDVSKGENMEITLIVDNGGNSLISQVWNSDALESITFEFNTGLTSVRLEAPFDWGLVTNTGVFRTDVKGELVSVMSEWVQLHAAANFETNVPSTSIISWNLNGYNPILRITDTELVRSNVSMGDILEIKKVKNWTISR